MPPSSNDEVDLTDILDRFNAAMKYLLLNDIYLLEHDVHERTITHKLGEYLQPLFRQWNVDCEYNRDMEGRLQSCK